MSKVYCYPVLGKGKSVDICKAFAAGCGGEVVMDGRLRDGDAFFYGVTAVNQSLWEAVLSRGSTFWVCDNSYFDSRRQVSFRITKNSLQHDGEGESDGKRFAALGIEIHPWRESGEHFVVCPQSDHFMKVLVGYYGDWGKNTLAYLRAESKRPVRFRDWNPNKGKLSSTLQADLVGAHALITWSSAAAVTAALFGIPAIVQSRDCAASALNRDGWSLEDLPTPDRTNWVGVLADNEWSMDEMRDGTAWKALNGGA